MELISNNRNWEDLRDRLRKEYPQLTEADLEIKEGMELCMLRMVEYKLKKTKQEMKEIITGIGYTTSDTYLHFKEKKGKSK